ncbi:hypothetical protein ONZ51_g4855 [Trametes cubensis]|uniref:MYND-type domain-containing protein n=1 Tax=Trametes cubensis TaxID=1111947 RepID=A0AAD7XE82_9APHY|nr:hypothetical protein ONZ51_g4855 [Trametes cubensis]
MPSSYLSGLETDGHESPELALYYLDPIIYPQWDTDVVMDRDYIASLPEATQPEQVARAHSLAAYAYLKKYYASEEDLRRIAQHAQSHPRQDTQPDVLDPLDNIIRAARHANWVASMGMTTPAALTAGFAFRDVAELLDVNIEEYSHLQPLRAALDIRDEELREIECEARILTGQLLPDPGVCAAPRCEVKPSEMQKITVVPCDGRCPSYMKPSYCSDWCRTTDWAKHRGICSARGAPEDPPPDTIERNSKESRHRLIAIMRSMEPINPLENLELVPYGEEERSWADPRNGQVLFVMDMLSAYGSHNAGRYAMKYYE